MQQQELFRLSMMKEGVNKVIDLVENLLQAESLRRR